MFEHVAQSLLSGNFICRVSDPDAYCWLETDDNRTAMTDWLSKIGRQLAATSGTEAYFCAVGPGIGPVRDAVRRTMALVRDELRPAVGFVDQCMRVLHLEARLEPGDELPLNAIVQVVASNVALQEDLSRYLLDLGRAGQGTDGRVRTQVLKIFSHMESLGYVVKTNEQLEIYRATGKMRWLYEAIEFIQSAEKLVDLAPEGSAKARAAGGLF